MTRPVRPVRSVRPVLDRETYLARWSTLHGGYDPAGSRFVHGWLRLTYALAAPLGRRGVSPDVLSLVGLGLGAALVAAAVPGGPWAIVPGVLAVVTGMTDGLDGAVAVLTGRTSRAGAVLDSVVDRVTDVAFFTALWIWGAPGLLVAGGMALTLMQEYARARAGAQGVAEIGVVTVWERSSRIIVVAFCGLAIAILPVRDDVLAGCAGAMALAGAAVAAGQLGLALRRLLRD